MSSGANFLVAVGHSFLSHVRMYCLDTEALGTTPNYAAAAAVGKTGCRFVISKAQLRLIAHLGNGAQRIWMGKAAAAAGAVMMMRGGRVRRVWRPAGEWGR